MKTKLIGLITSIALLGSGTALAGGDWKKHDKQQQQQQEQTQTQTPNQGRTGQVITTEGTAQGGSGTLGQGTEAQQGSTQQQAQQGSTQQLGSNEIIGRVVKSSKKMVWVEHAGAIVPLKIDKKTQFNDPNLKRAQDFQEGDRVRASFEVRETENIVKSIQKSDSNLGGSGSNLGPGSDTGGSGTNVGSDIGGDSDVLTSDTTRYPNSLPPSHLDDVMGGSGPDSIHPPDIDDEGNSSKLGTDSAKGDGDY